MSVECMINDEVSVSVNFDRLAFLQAACAAKQIPEGSVSISFVSPEKIVELNQNYLKRDYITDIISFNLAENAAPIMGDIYICPFQAELNATEFEQTLDNEIKLLIVHGLLHVLGYADYTEDEQLEMRHQESLLLDQLHNGH